MSFFQGIFQEDNGKWSFSRVSCAYTLFASTAWVTYALFIGGKIPDLGGLTGYVAATLGVLYGSNKIASAITDGKTE